MIKILRILKNLLPQKWKLTGKIGDLNDWVHHRISITIGACERLREVILFIPVIYKSVRWDQSSIFNILHHWLGRMEDAQRTCSHHLYAERYADQLRQCVLILDRIKNDVYMDMAFKEHEERWGEHKIWFTPFEDNKDLVRYNSTRANIKTKEDKELERKEFRQCVERMEYLYDQDIELLFKIIKKHHRHWWC